METDDDIMSAEEFFGEIGELKKAPRKCRSRGKTPETLFAAVKAKMVMRIHGVSRAQALEIIARREAEKKAPEAEETARKQSGRRGHCPRSAADFFGEI